MHAGRTSDSICIAGQGLHVLLTACRKHYKSNTEDCRGQSYMNCDQEWAKTISRSHMQEEAKRRKFTKGCAVLCHELSPGLAQHAALNDTSQGPVFRGQSERRCCKFIIGLWCLS